MKASKDLPVYPGTELEIFANATHWKAYWFSQIQHLVKGRVVEVGAGIGSNTALMMTNAVEAWTCIEPDAVCFGELKKAQAEGRLPENVELHQGTLSDLETGADSFDTIIYIDVLEHIEEDQGELMEAIGSLNPGGVVIVLVPAYPWLMCEFDRSIGHHRRYTLPMLRALEPGGCEVMGRYLDSVGLLASLGNRLLLRHDVPSLKQVKLWDRYLVPLSRVVDLLLLRRVGRSALMVWRRDEA